MYSSSPINDLITDVNGPSSLALAPPQPPRMTAAPDVPSTEAIPPDSILRSHSPITWSSGLCDCGRDWNSCCLTCWCPCIAFGRIAEMVDRGSTACGVSGTVYELMMCLTGCPWVYSCFYRSKMRGQYYLEESPCADCCVHCCCEECALCQEYRELQNQGFDLSIGWHGNMERHRRLAQPSLITAPRALIPTLEFQNIN